MVKLCIFLFLVLSLSFSGLVYAKPALPTEKETDEMNAVLRSITQEPVWLNTSRALTPEDLKGRVILLDFWTFCCINCIHIMPDLHSLEEEFGDKLTVIGVHSAKFANERDTENIRAAILRYGLEHPVVNDSQFHIWQDFGIRGWPALVLINPLGMIKGVYSGEGNKEAIRHDINIILNQFGDRVNHSPLPIALEKNKQPPSILSFPGKLVYAEDTANGPLLFIADSGHNRIVGVNLQGEIKLTIGSGKKGLQDGDFKQAEFNTPEGLLYHEGMLFVADTENHALRKIDIKNQKVETLAGTGKQGYERVSFGEDALKTPLSSPWDLALFPDTHTIAIAMAGTHQLWTYDLNKKTVSVLAGNGRESIDDGRYPVNSLSQPSGLSARGDALYFVDSETSSLRKWEDNRIDTLIGTGLFDFGYKEGKQGEARLQHPLGVYADEKGEVIADSYNHSLRYYDNKQEKLTNFAGHGVRGNKNGTLREAEFNEPNAVVKIGELFYVADTNNHKIRIIDPAKDTVSDFTLTLPAEFTLADDLPNMQKLGKLNLTAGEAITVQLQLDNGWKINAEAPSSLVLFKGKQPVKHFSREELHQKWVMLPALDTGEDYRLQGTLYYCEDKAGALCLIKSFDGELLAGKEGSRTIALNLKGNND